MDLKQLIERFSKSRYTRLLETQLEEVKEELRVARLENRALTNSLLGTAGVPPIDQPVVKSPEIPNRRSWHQIQANTERESVLRMQQRAEALREKADPTPPNAA